MADRHALEMVEPELLTGTAGAFVNYPYHTDNSVSFDFGKIAPGPAGGSSGPVLSTPDDGGFE